MKIIKTFFCTLLLLPCLLSAQTKEITVADIWKNYRFLPQSVPGFASMPNTDCYSVVTDTAIVKYNFATGQQEEVVLSNSMLNNKTAKNLKISNIDDYSFDESCSKILFAIESEPIYRRSTCAYYFVYDFKTGETTPVAATEKGKQSFAQFSADGSKVAFVRDYNLYYCDLNTKSEKQITTDGLENNILNGFADWVHEEELDMSQCYYWSPDGNQIAFLRFDESAVKEFSMTIWGELYPQEYKYKYPKAGEENSKVEIHLFDLRTNTTRKINLEPEDCYYPRIYWLPNANEFIFLKLNRLQNKLDFYRFNTQTNAMDIVLTDSNPCWLEVSNDYYFLDDNKTMIFTSERNGYNHIYKAEFGQTPQQLTTGQMEVKEICAIDFAKRRIYYLSNEAAVLNQDLYSIDFNGKKKQRLTDGTGWNVATFNSNAHYYCNVYSNSNTPQIYTLHDNTGKVIDTLENNAAFCATIKNYGFAPKEHFSFVTKDNVSLNGWMIKPATFDPSRQYPVLMYVYGGPGSQEVTNSYFRSNDHAWYQMLAQKGYIIVCVDGRGTAGRGDELKKVVYKQMGKYETLDQIETATYLKTLPYVDKDRIGIWGWSFGGYLSSLAMFKGKGVFKMAMSVAPVTNWRYYDNIYTERFLQRPQDNPDGYDDNSPCFFADQLEGNYLLVHGTADDNVHFQNSMSLVTQLNHYEKQYEQFFYPNKNHFIYGGNTRYHLYVKLTDFVLKNL